MDLENGVIRVRRTVVELPTGELRTGPPKSAAGRRTIFLDDFVLDDIRTHFAVYVESKSDAFVFSGSKGAQLRRSTFQRNWRRGLAAADLVGRVHFHDLRHTGNTWAAESGATLQELMERMGHASSRAALIYQHTNDERRRKLARGMSERVRKELQESPDGANSEDLPEASGT
ncbi:tyrosine-type recombinase/integrase [Kribbella sp. CA-293567]|uniref:tyrosine-type recombinase/integrase n=1 Tax=Kribbella sp. CA-293567 TaxID=3002436 RepID=UPI0022DE4788|nr:site-specific integrase [Kribbella sp. CA-293567]WBQ05778.1 site-specific integrase [Kribbella sp. CA-293567]